MNQLIGQTIGRYRITELLGQGGMAVVYKAFDTQLERDVAIKLIRVGAFPPDILDHVLERFKREAKTLARLNHPNIVKVHDFGEIDGAPFLVMDFLSGHTFKEIRKPMHPEAAAKLLLPIAEALSYAHSQGVFHRDIKPSNIILNDDQLPILMDFGISKLLEEERGYTLTSTGIGLGTPEYMAPEQGLGKAIDGRADLYSMGIVFYELITGHKPYQADTAFAVLYKQMNDSLPDPRQFVPDLSDEVEQFLSKALAKKPNDRYSDMEEFKKGLSSLISNKQTSQEKKPQEDIQSVLLLENSFANQEALELFPPLKDVMLKKKERKIWILFVILAIMIGLLTDKLLLNIRTSSSINKETVTEMIPHLIERSEITQTKLPTLTATMNTQIPIINHPKKIAFVKREPSGNQISVIDLDSHKEENLNNVSSNQWIYGNEIITYKNEALSISTTLKELICTGFCNKYEKYILKTIYGQVERISEKKLDNSSGCTYLNDWNGGYRYSCPEPNLSIFLDNKRIISGKEKVYYPVWAPDGSRFSYLSLLPGDVDLFIVDHPEKNIQVSEMNLTNSIKGEISRTSWSLDNSRIVFSFQSKKTVLSAEICFIELSTNQVVCITKNDVEDTWPMFSPDNQFIAFSRRENGIFNIYIYDLKSKTEKKVTNFSFDCIMPLWIGW